MMHYVILVNISSEVLRGILLYIPFVAFTPTQDIKLKLTFLALIN